MLLRLLSLLPFVCLPLCTQAQPDFYSGTINNKIPIKATLTWDAKAQKYTGSYFYVSVGEEIKLESKPIAAANRYKDSVEIMEYIDSYPHPHAVFKGLFTKNGELKGTWSGEGKKFPFQLRLENSVKIAYVTKGEFTYPQARGMTDAAVMAKVNALLKEFKKGRNEFKEEENYYREDSDFQIVFNGKNVLTVCSMQVSRSLEEENELSEGFTMGTSLKYTCIHLKTGNLLKYSDVLTEASKKTILTKINADYSEDCNRTIENPDEVLNRITLSQKGVMFPTPNCGAQGKYDEDVPFTLPYSKVKAYLRPDGE